MPHTRHNRYRENDPFFSLLPDNVQAPLLGLCGEYYRAIGDSVSYDKSVRKMDFKSCHDYRDVGGWHQSFNYVFEAYKARFRGVGHPSPEEILVSTNISASCGVPLCYLGFKTKEDVLRSPWGRSYLTLQKDYIPVWKVVPKTEWYHATDLDNGKVRTFIIPPLRFLFAQKLLYHKQNVAMKDFSWSAYGFNPYSGGVHDLALRLQKNPIMFAYDVKGWDRLFPLMGEVYKIRNSCVAERFVSLASFVTAHTIDSVLLLADGTVVLKEDISNNSGSNNTTTDNIIGHELIITYCLFELFDDMRVVCDCFCYLFGDDNVGSMPDYGYSLEHLKQHFTRIFAQFGYELDPIIFTRDIRDLEFLGFRFHSLNGRFIPRYNLSRLATAFCYRLDKKNSLSVTLSKAYSLMVMSWPHGPETYRVFSSAYEQLLFDAHDTDDSTAKHFVDAGVPSDNSLAHFYSGFESSLELFDGGWWNKISHVESYAERVPSEPYRSPYWAD